MVPVIFIVLGAAALAVIAGASGAGYDPASSGAGVIKEIDLEKATATWRSSGWGARVDALQQQLSDPEEIAVVVAKDVFPDYEWPAYVGMPPSNLNMWKEIVRDVWSYLGIEGDPFPAR